MADDLVSLIGPGFVPHPRGALASLRVDGETLLLDEDAGDVHRLNPTASVAWERFRRRPGTVREHAQDLAAAFDADRDRIERDLVALAGAMVRSGLLATPATAAESRRQDPPDAAGAQDGRADAPRTVPVAAST